MPCENVLGSRFTVLREIVRNHILGLEKFHETKLLQVVKNVFQVI